MNSRVLTTVRRLCSQPPYCHRYEASDVRPIPVQSTEHLSPDEASQICSAYNSKGFAIFELAGSDVSTDGMTALAERLRLGPPFVPQHYAMRPELYDPSGLNTISVSTGAKHRAFETTNAQQLHSDGTLQQAGYVKTSILLCVRPAEIGGETTVFNSVGAFSSLAKDDPEAALALINPSCLTRRNVNLTNDYYTGPAFTVETNEICSRFSLDNTSDWSQALEVIPHLERGYTKLTTLACVGSPYYLQFKLGANQGIIMTNDRISHGRTAYQDAKSPRKMIRGLYLQRPVATG